jgi:hypothetical protein
MTEAEADREASKRNRELGADGVDDRYWIEVQLPSGDWTVECRWQRKSIWRKLWDAFMATPGP